MDKYLNALSKFPQLSSEQPLECEKSVTEKELSETLKSMPNHLMTISWKDGLTKGFFETFWSEVKKVIFTMYFTFFW